MNNNSESNGAVDGALTELKQQYETLIEDIKKKHQEQQKIFEEIAKKNYDGDDYQQDRINHLIEENVVSLKKQRDKIWQYLSNQYNQNTRDTYQNLRNLKKNQHQIDFNKKRKEELIHKVKDTTQENNTQKKLISHNKYQKQKIGEDLYIQFIITISLIICIIILYLSSIEIISDVVGYGVVGVIVLITVCYYIYRVYYHRMNKDKVHWHKIYYNRIQNPTEEELLDEERDELDYDKLDADAKKLFSKYKSKCANVDSI